jgi:hypothetical protein
MMADVEQRTYDPISAPGSTATATFCNDCEHVVPIGQDYHQCPKRGKVRLR